MKTVRPATPVAIPPVGSAPDADDDGPGARLRRRHHRRRLFREELLAIAVLIIALAATLLVLGLQWLGSGQSGTPGAVPAPTYLNIVGGPT